MKLWIKLNYYILSELYSEWRKIQNSEQKCPWSHSGRVKLGYPILSERALGSRDGPITLLLLSPGYHAGSPFVGMKLPTLVSKVFASNKLSYLPMCATRNVKVCDPLIAISLLLLLLLYCCPLWLNQCVRGKMFPSSHWPLSESLTEAILEHRCCSKACSRS